VCCEVIKLGNLSEIVRVCLSTNALVTGVVTIGLITIITYIAFMLERKVSSASSFMKKAAINVSEMVLLLFVMFIVEKVFESLTGGTEVELGGLFANAELTILFYCLFIFNNRLIVLMNILLPFIYHPSLDIARMTGSFWWLFIIAYIALVVVIDYLYGHKDDLLVSNYKYWVSQILFGVCWWIVLWIDNRFPLPDMIGMLILFEVYMLIVRIIEQKMSTYMHAYTDLQTKVNYDALTGARNRSNFNKLSKEAYDKYCDSKEPLTVIMFDIDRFKNFNDHYGHEIGDEVLRHVSHIVERELHIDGSKGQLFRYGGEEFVILMRNIDSQRCESVINGINKTMMEMPLYIQDQQLQVTLCFGVTTLKSDDKSFDDTFKRVDGYLYDSKNNGRNKMTIEGKTLNYDFDVALKI